MWPDLRTQGHGVGGLPLDSPLLPHTAVIPPFLCGGAFPGLPGPVEGVRCVAIGVSVSPRQSPERPSEALPSSLCGEKGRARAGSGAATLDIQPRCARACACVCGSEKCDCGRKSAETPHSRAALRSGRCSRVPSHLNVSQLKVVQGRCLQPEAASRGLNRRTQLVAPGEPGARAPIPVHAATIHHSPKRSVRGQAGKGVSGHVCSIFSAYLMRQAQAPRTHCFLGHPGYFYTLAVVLSAFSSSVFPLLQGARPFL